ncbi:NAD(P)-dependent dehydrogenase, short-chain alcohol dehydrogenase family [Pseudonocardia thermophila]|uniref:NAD(P)-dependent dehydrogenase, short-chain alcohol dehydrogenase family n=1 Tax=Pseudonocardia thermophila TaxID=1848 RepID=A0A1M6WQF4_PSETH|nr:SDR family oxidoreductase [Pseudonocardia thermophila]SHK95973.1 NAD(P)-dependent dehydrogenase, short-chain alcohol dehydrogenase family [Pseudonocardia thermophila]
MSGRLRGKVAVVVGAGSGIGRATAEMFAAEGAAVVCVGRRAAKVSDTAAAIENAGGRALALSADMAVEAEAERMATEALAWRGKVDAVVAGAGVTGPGTAVTTSLADFQRVLAINLTSKWLSFKYFLPGMQQRGSGSVVVMASVGALIGVPNTFAYAASQGGCTAMVRQAAQDAAPYGVRINAIAPGTVPTDLVREAYRQGSGLGGGGDVEVGLRAAATRYPLGRLGRPEEIAAAATYLVSDESAWMTGQTLTIDGGLTSA